MKRLAAAIIATALLTGTARAQNRDTPPAPRHTQEQPVRSQAAEAPQRPAVRKADASRYPAPPKHWGKKSHQQWQSHVDRCRAEYRSYDPRTDRFSPRRGQSAICRL